jgi:hypothetical protein
MTNKPMTNPRSQKSSAPGFSLIELMISGTILIQMLLSTAQLLLLAQQMKNRYRDHLITIGMISDQIEYFRSLSFESPELAPGEGLRIRTDTDSGLDFIVRWTVRFPSPSLKTLEMACYPKNQPRRRTTTTLYLSSDLGF